MIAHVLKMNNEDIVISAPQEATSIYKIVTTEAIQLPSRAELVVNVRIEGAKADSLVGVVEPINTDLRKSVIFLTKILLQIDKI